MNKIILYGEKEDDKIRNFLIENLKSLKKVNFEQNGISKTYGQGDIIEIIECDNLKNLKSEKEILILKNNAEILNIENFEGIVIVNSNNTQQLKKLSKLGAKVISCGMYLRDSITMSSNNDNCHIVAIQRQINFSKKTLVQPSEVKVFSEKTYEEYMILCYIAVISLLGEINNKNCFKIV